ncbi:MAG: hypothetical protein LBQ60_14880 [Bacteroidales bacterium]|nr:hypothetical protein [Bacteroidales bacterium]
MNKHFRRIFTKNGVISVCLKSGKTFFLTIGVLLFVLILPGCEKDKDKDEDEGGPNKFTYSGKTVSVTGAAQGYFGHIEPIGDKAITMLLVIGNSDVAFYFTMLIPNGNDKLLAGTYPGSIEYKPYTVIEGWVEENDEITASLSSAIITVELSESTYTIDINGTLENNKSISGNYTGEVPQVDMTEEEEAPGSMTIELDGKEDTYVLKAGGQLKMDLTGTTGSYFLVNLPGENDSTLLSLSFMSPMVNDDLLTPGEYIFTGEAAREPGNAYASIKKQPKNPAMNSTEGTVVVKKSSSTYDISFDFITNSTPPATVTGTYYGLLNKVSLFPSSMSRMKKGASSRILLEHPITNVGQ